MEEKLLLIQEKRILKINYQQTFFTIVPQL